MSETWEARMAARTEERRALAKTMGAKDPWDISWERAEREEWQLQARMTLGEAMRFLRGAGWACACTGFPDCCVYRGAQARALQRAAHIVARLLSDFEHAEKPPPRTEVQSGGIGPAPAGGEQ